MAAVVCVVDWRATGRVGLNVDPLVKVMMGIMVLLMTEDVVVRRRHVEWLSEPQGPEGTRICTSVRMYIVG